MMKIVLSILMLSIFSLASPKFQIANNYIMDYSKDTKCLVRKLAIYKEPKWASKIELINGKKIFFSSPKSMFEFYYRPGKWFDIGVKSEEDFKDIIVTDYITMKPINAREAFYIYGTNVISPAGDDLVAIDGEYNAKEFSLKHNGKRVLRFNEVSDALIRLLNGRI